MIMNFQCGRLTEWMTAKDIRVVVDACFRKCTYYVTTKVYFFAAREFDDLNERVVSLSWESLGYFFHGFFRLRRRAKERKILYTLRLRGRSIILFFLCEISFFFLCQFYTHPHTHFKKEYKRWCNSKGIPWIAA